MPLINADETGSRNGMIKVVVGAVLAAIVAVKSHSHKSTIYGRTKYRSR